jgi:chlorobactene glucosyltransferase
MLAGMDAARIAAAAWAAALAVVVRDERSIPRLDPAADAPGSVTAIVAARDEEADVGETLRRLVAQRHAPLQVVAVDDESTDGTRAAMEAVPGVEVVAGAAPPTGWLGKPWACRQGAERATSDWLLFLDADVRFEPGAVGALLAFAREGGALGATAFPRLLTGSAAERAVLPLAGVIMQTAIIPAWLARARWSPVAIGVGGCLLLRRDLYDRIGGHAAVRGEVVEDLALARAAKRAGQLLPWARGDAVFSLRYQKGARGVWTGWRKNAAHAWRGPWPVALAAGSLAMTAVVAPWNALLRRRRPAGAVGVVLQAATLRVSAGATDVPAPYALGAPVAAAFMSAVGLASLADRVSGRGARWRGRRIPSS